MCELYKFFAGGQVASVNAHAPLIAHFWYKNIPDKIEGWFLIEICVELQCCQAGKIDTVENQAS